MVNEMGAHSDSGQHHTVSPSTPSMTGARTPHSMLPVMRKGTSVFEVRKRRPAAASASRAAIALADGGELYLEGLLVALGGTELVGRQLGGHGLVLFQVLVLHEDHGRRQKLGDGLGHHRAHLVVGLKLAHVALQEVLEPGQIEVPVLHGPHLGDGARERGYRGDEVHWRVLVPQIALVGVGVLRLAALHGAVALHLAAVQEGAGLSVVELQGGIQLQVAALVQALDELVGDHLVHVARVPDAASLVDVQAHLEGLEGRLLALMVGEHVVGDGARRTRRPPPSLR